MRVQRGLQAKRRVNRARDGDGDEMDMNVNLDTTLRDNDDDDDDDAELDMEMDMLNPDSTSPNDSKDVLVKMMALLDRKGEFDGNEVTGHV